MSTSLKPDSPRVRRTRCWPVLAARELLVDDRARETITSCTDIGQLKNWLTRAITATNIKEIFS